MRELVFSIELLNGFLFQKLQFNFNILFYFPCYFWYVWVCILWFHMGFEIVWLFWIPLRTRACVLVFCACSFSTYRGNLLFRYIYIFRFPLTVTLAWYMTLVCRHSNFFLQLHLVAVGVCCILVILLWCLFVICRKFFIAAITKFLSVSVLIFYVVSGSVSRRFDDYFTYIRF